MSDLKFTKRILQVSKLKREDLISFLRKERINLTFEEVKRIANLLGRDPSIVELHIFNVEWSEHCSYKSSKKILKKYLPTKGSHVILGPGEDSGIVYLTTWNNERYGIVIAHESHNHPSQVLPVEGAATGIGGIVRDVDCMGAEVIGVADGLRFGNPYGKNKERTKWIAGGVVQGIWEYANALGVPNIGGDLYFSDSFDDNCLVNVVAIGIVKEKNIIHSKIPSKAREIPYDIILVGKPTDASGFGGASFASEILDEEKEEEKKGAVQVHDPFLKNVLLMKKANYMVWKESQKRGYEIGMKDLGAAGIVGASSEIGEAGKIGVEIYLDDVHTAVENLLPEVILCSETQERYIFSVPHEFTPEVLRIYNEVWELPKIYKGAQAKVIGKTRKDKRYVVYYKGEVVCDIPIEKVTEGIEYERKYISPKRSFSEPVYSVTDFNETFLKILSSPNIASREYVYRFYDTEVQGKAVIRPGESDAGVIAPLDEIGSPVGVAFSLDGNPFYGRIDPYLGGANAVSEAIRNVACTGAIPWCLTDCLNFGNPEKPEAFYDFVEGVRGISDAAKNLWLYKTKNPIPIVSGNVSFYNESATGKSIDPSPIIGCIGVLNDYSKSITYTLKNKGDAIYLIGKRYDEMGGSEFYRVILNKMGKNVPKVRWDEERRNLYTVIESINKGAIKACHDISDGGLAVTLAEMMIGGRKKKKLGIKVNLDVVEGKMPFEKLLFSQSSGYVVEVKDTDKFEKIAKKNGAYFYKIGKITGKPYLEINMGNEKIISLSLEKSLKVWRNAVPQVFQ